MLTSRLSEMDNTVHRLLDFQEEVKSSQSEERTGGFLVPLSRLLSQFTKVQ